MSADIFHQTLASVPVGHYTSYGEIAGLCGVHVRQVLAWLRVLPADSELPWFRILNSQRRISEHPGATRQYQLLAVEGLLPDHRGKFPKNLYWRPIES
ncbi:MGMT family protein [Reinekea sp.]|uniref:MGMT family protein n=1 Tax=Reinekea sp. TaxID=1970455 RepID=UPI002A7F5AA9|nr:MGMT family protein [Reinekea sp.]